MALTKTYEVEVQRTIHTTVRVEAGSPLAAAAIVNKFAYPLPPESDWDVLDGWEFTVRDPVTEEELYEGGAPQPGDPDGGES